MDGIQSTAASSTQSRQLLDEKGKMKLQRAVQEFEALMLSTMLKSMRSGIPKSDMFGDSYGGDMLEGMFDIELSRHMSRSRSLGMGEMLYKEITGEELPRKSLPAGGGVAPKTGQMQGRATKQTLERSPSPSNAGARQKAPHRDPRNYSDRL